MKKNIFYILTLLVGLCSFSSCHDDDDIAPDAQREFMTMFRVDNNTGRGENDPYRCQVVNRNAFHLYWYGVKDCAGYEIKMALQPNVSSGLASDWENPDYILLDTIVGPDKLDMMVEHLQYGTQYRFAIRTLSAKGEAYHSKWYGYGNGRQWAEWYGDQTEYRYAVPSVIEQTNIERNKFRVNLNRAYANSGDDATTDFKSHFEVDGNGNFVMQKLTVEPSPTNPDAAVPEQFRNYTLTEEDFARGYIDIEGLDENSVYNVNVVNENVPYNVDAVYNTLSVRTDGVVGEPILIKHIVDPADTIKGAKEYNACRIDTIINNFTKDNSLAEGQIFYLEGGKTYYLANNTGICKGFTLRTNPEDLAAGKGRAKVLLNGMSTINNAPVTMNFMFGRQPQLGDLGEIYVKSVIFEDIDFDCPLALFFDGKNNGTGNYFINMYSDGMQCTFQSLTIRNCSFQHMVRGFLRVQGPKRKRFQHILIENCEFYNNGFYDNKGSGYPWITADDRVTTTNIFMDCVFRNNTIYDSPRTSLFTNGTKNIAYTADVHYNITVENNTFVNFSTRTSGQYMFSFRYIPAGSSITVKKNLFILAKANGDKRPLNFAGMDIRNIVNSGELSFDICDNYSTSNNLTSGQIFSSGAFSAKKNSAGTWPTWNVSGASGLNVIADDITNEELMVAPNPKHITAKGDGSDCPGLMHYTDNLDGLYFRNSAKVLNSAIYTKGIGASKWRTTLK
jgi:hypothetical protein